MTRERSPVFSAAVVGLGRIGQGYDYEHPDGSPELTHASAFAAHEGFELTGGVDPDSGQRARFERKFGRAAYETVEDLLAAGSPHVFAIAAPAASHASIMNQIAGASPRAVICEKPIADDVIEARSMLEVARRSGISLAVNYTRRFDPGVVSLREALHDRPCGDLYKGVVWYFKGLMDNGSHHVDLLRFLLGEVTRVELLRTGPTWGSRDMQPDVMLEFGDVVVYVLAARDEKVPFNDLLLMGTNGFINYADGGHRIEAVRFTAAAGAPGRPASRTVEEFPSELFRYQWHAADALYRHLVAGTPLASDGASALGTLEVIEWIRELRAASVDGRDSLQ